MRITRQVFGCMFCIVILSTLVTAQTSRQREAEPAYAYDQPNPDTYRRIANEVDTALLEDVAEVWFPRALDEQNGGYYSSFSREWRPTHPEGKFSAFQGHMTAIAGQMAVARPDLRAHFVSYAQHGVDYLLNAMWDKQNGGFFWGLNDAGQISLDYTSSKHLYGMSFCIAGLVAGYQATEDQKALDLAQESFRWIDQHAHDAKNGGYFEWLTRDGRVIQLKPGSVTTDEIKPSSFPLGYKSMDTHVHLLAAYTDLYKVWKDDTLRQRLEELLAITRDKIAVEPGAMSLYFTNDWRPVPGHDSYGHDVEAARIMLEAAEALGHYRDAETERVAKMLVDHALAYGWDNTNGGIYREGTALGSAEDVKKQWWQQVENLEALLIMHERYGYQNEAYFRAFQRQWTFIKERQIDPKYGGLYVLVQRDGTLIDSNKGSIWKDAYSDGHAFLNVHARLMQLAGGK